MSRYLVRSLMVLGTALLVVVAVALVALQVAKERIEPFGGTTVGGYLPHQREHYADWLKSEAQRRGSALVRMVAPSATFDSTLEQLGIDVDVQAMLLQAERQRQSGSLGSQFWRYLSAVVGQQDLAWITSFDPERARTALSSLAPAVEAAPVNASVDLVKRRRTYAQSGRRLDLEGTVDWLALHRDIELTSFTLAMTEVRPQVTDDQVSPIDVSRVLGSYETEFRHHAGTRAINIRVAARSLNGVIIGPGEVFSFNRVVGPRVVERGFREAPVIVDDELEPGVGGGVCQVATTVHAAAVLSGFEVVERRSHSRPSAYAPMGLDATVIDGNVDLKFRNPYQVPLVISTSFPDPFRLRVELVGLSLATQFVHTFAVEKRRDYYRRVVTKVNLKAGAFERKQKGNFGYDVISTVTEKVATGSPKVRRYRSKYWPVPEVYWIGPNTNYQDLPPLAEGVAGVQLDGSTVFGKIPSDVEARAQESQADEALDGL